MIIAFFSLGLGAVWWTEISCVSFAICCSDPFVIISCLHILEAKVCLRNVYLEMNRLCSSFRVWHVQSYTGQIWYHKLYCSFHFSTSVSEHHSLYLSHFTVPVPTCNISVTWELCMFAWRQEYCKKLHGLIDKLDEERYDIEAKVQKTDKEVNWPPRESHQKVPF